MLPSARPLTTSWPMMGSESAFPDRARQFRGLALVAIDAKRMGEIAETICLVGDQHALPVLGRRKRVADRDLVAADLLDDRFEEIDGVVIGDSEVVGRNLELVLHALGPIQNLWIGRRLRDHAANR